MLLLLSVVAALALYQIVSANKTTLTIGYLTAIRGELKDKQGLAISGALTLALEEVNKKTVLSVNRCSFDEQNC